MKMVRITAQWCTSCLIMKKRWKDFINVDSFDEIIDFDYDDDVDQITSYEVGNILPVVIIYDDHSNELKRMIGEISKKQLKKELEEVTR